MDLTDLLFPHYEDHRGDFCEAQQWLAAQLDATENTEELFDLMLWKAKLQMMQGENRKAEENFAAIAQLLPDDHHRQLLLKSLELLLMYERYNRFPNGAGSEGVEIGTRWQGSTDMQALNTAYWQVRSETDDVGIQWVAWYIYEFIGHLVPFRYLIKSNTFTPSEMDIDSMLSPYLQTASSIIENAIKSDQIAITTYVFQTTADICRRAGQQDLGEEYLAKMLAQAKEINDLEGQAWALMTMGDWKSAPFSRPELLNFAMIPSAVSASNLATTVESLEFERPTENKLLSAQEDYQSACKLFEKANCKRGLGALRLREGFVLFLNKNYSKFKNNAQESKIYYKNTADWRAFHLANIHECIAELCLGNNSEASLLAEQTAKWGKDNNCFSYTLGLGILLNRFGRHQLIRGGDFEKALAAFRTAQVFFKTLGAETHHAQSIVDEGDVYAALSEQEAARTQYEKGIDCYHRLTQLYPKKHPYGNVGIENIQQRILFLAGNNYQLALQRLDADSMESTVKRIKIIHAELPVSTDFLIATEINSLKQLGQSYIEQAHFLVPLYRSRAARQAGKLEQFEREWQKASASLKTTSRANRDFFEAILWAEKEDYDRATACYHRYMNQGGASGGFAGKLANLMAQIGGQAGQVELQLQDYRTQMQAFSTWVKLKQFEEAEKCHLLICQIKGEKWWQEDSKPWLLLCDLAEMFGGLGEHKKAIVHFDLAIQELESRRALLSRAELKTAISAEKGVQYLYFAAALAAMCMENYGLAFEYAEKGQARGLLDLMSASSLMAGLSDVENNTLGRWRELNAQQSLKTGQLARERMSPNPDSTRIEQLTQSILQKEQERQNLEVELKAENPQYAQLLSSEADTLNADQVAKYLSKNKLLVEYIFLDDHILIWTINQKGILQIVLNELDSHTLNRQINKLRTALERGGSYQKIRTSLSEKLILPIQESLSQYDELIIVPYGALHTLPFQILELNNVPLFKNKQISYIPSASIIQFINKNKSSVKNEILAVGNPTGDLKAASIEAELVAQLFDTQAITEENASKDRIREEIGKSRILHFATHGDLREDAPLLSALRLAAGEKLSVAEIMGIQLKADLVVLSACNSGRGNRTKGDDLIGLSQGFLAAGASALIVSLWAVDDVSTAIMMLKFYQLIKEGKEPNQALQLAQNHVRAMSKSEAESYLSKLSAKLSDGKTRSSLDQVRATRGLSWRTAREKEDQPYSHPFYWAGWTLINA